MTIVLLAVPFRFYVFIGRVFESRGDLNSAHLQDRKQKTVDSVADANSVPRVDYVLDRLFCFNRRSCVICCMIILQVGKKRLTSTIRVKLAKNSHRSGSKKICKNSLDCTVYFKY